MNGPVFRDQSSLKAHDPRRIILLERCLISISAQVGVNVHLHIVLQGFGRFDQSSVEIAARRTLEGSSVSYFIEMSLTPKIATSDQFCSIE